MLPSHYRISIKALIYNEKGNFLLCQEKSGVRDFPWWWLDHGESPEECLRREIHEEMWLKVTYIAPQPIHFLTAHKPTSQTRPRTANVLYEVRVEDVDFTPSDECVGIDFFNPKTCPENALVNVHEFITNTQDLSPHI